MSAFRLALVVVALAVAIAATADAAAAGAIHRHHRRPPTPPPPRASGRGAAPLLAMRKHVCGLHRAAEHSHEQMIAHHYCSKQLDGLTQCALFDSDKPNAKLIGVEYIVTAERFKALPETERKLWHSHVFEVESGMLTPMPLAGGRNADVPIAEQRATLQELMGTFGKTIHTWNFHALDSTIPTGAPQLMVSFTGPDQAKEELLAKLDERAGNRHWERAAWRRTGPNALTVPPVVAKGLNGTEFRGVDAWQTGVTPVIRIEHIHTDTRQLPAEAEALERKKALPYGEREGIARPDGAGDVEVELQPARAGVVRARPAAAAAADK